MQPGTHQVALSRGGYRVLVKPIFEFCQSQKNFLALCLFSFGYSLRVLVLLMDRIIDTSLAAANDPVQLHLPIVLKRWSLKASIRTVI
jgi:CHASE1-domain containing sensor protein